MIRHEAPAQQPIRLSVVEPKVLLNHPSNAGIAEVTRPKPAIQQDFHLPEPLAVVLQLHCRGPLVAEFSRNGVGQPVSNELPDAGGVEVGQVTSRVPAFEPKRLVLLRRLVMPLALFSNDLMGGLAFHAGR